MGLLDAIRATLLAHPGALGQMSYSVEQVGAVNLSR
jgi:hypothetical protein